MAHIPPPQPAPSQGGSGMNVVLMVLGVLGVLGVFCAGGLGVLFYTVFNQANASALRARDANNMAQIAMAMMMYESDHGSLPPAYVTDANGKPLYSWRVLLLPYLEQNVMYEAWHKDEAWDSPHNMRLSKKVLSSYSTPSSNKLTQPFTNYVVVQGEETPFQPGGKGIHLREIRDGLSNTIVVVSLADSDIHWSEPRDLNFSTLPMQINSSETGGISSKLPNGAHVGFADGSVHFLPDATDSTTLRSFLTRDGGEAVSLNPASF